MKQPLYDERDYTFGQAMLTLRTHMNLTQTTLARVLGVSRKAISRWEAGDAYPKHEHLKAFLTLSFQQQAFPPGREEEEIRAFWQTAHQRVSFDELWLQELLGTQGPQDMSPPSEQASFSEPGNALVTQNTPRVDWDDALDVSGFYGRDKEMAKIFQWIMAERCRVICILGPGGMGKSVFAIRFMRMVAPHFTTVIWRSLRDAPTCEALLDDCLQVLASPSPDQIPASLEQRLNLLLEYLRTQRTLLVLDNLETLLEQDSGRMRAGYESYGQLLRCVAEVEHQSCVLFTSREKPLDLTPYEEDRTALYIVRLGGLNVAASRQLLEKRHLVGNAQHWTRLVEMYTGNPLALNIVAQTIVELFDGEIAPFLKQNEVIFGGLRELLGKQFERLPAIEQTLLLWLAMGREPLNLTELLDLSGSQLQHSQVQEAANGLLRRSLVERGQRPGSFVLQSVVLEYATTLFIENATDEIKQDRLES